MKAKTKKAQVHAERMLSLERCNNFLIKKNADLQLRPDC